MRPCGVQCAVAAVRYECTKATKRSRWCSHGSIAPRLAANSQSCAVAACFILVARSSPSIPNWHGRGRSPWAGLRRRGRAGFIVTRRWPLARLPGRQRHRCAVHRGRLLHCGPCGVLGGRRVSGHADVDDQLLGFLEHQPRQPADGLVDEPESARHAHQDDQDEDGVVLTPE